MGHSGSVIGFVLVIVLLLFLAVRLGRSFRRTTSMLKRPDYWDPQQPDLTRTDSAERDPAQPGGDGGGQGGHGHASGSGSGGDHGGSHGGGFSGGGFSGGFSGGGFSGGGDSGGGGHHG
jgi:hypothetical protein